AQGPEERRDRGQGAQVGRAYDHGARCGSEAPDRAHERAPHPGVSGGARQVGTERGSRPMATLATDTRPFAPFEWMLALRYLRARRSEGFISVLAGFSFLGILLGVFTLITVMAVMNGFRKELFSKILGLNGHIIVHKIGGDDFDNYDEAAQRLVTIPGVRQVMPLVEGQAMASMPHLAVAGLVRGMREEDVKSLRLVAGNIRFGSLDGFDRQEGV